MWSRAVTATTLMLVRAPVVAERPPLDLPRPARTPARSFSRPACGSGSTHNLTVREAFTLGWMRAEQSGLSGAMLLRARFPGGSATRTRRQRRDPSTHYNLTSRLVHPSAASGWTGIRYAWRLPHGVDAHPRRATGGGSSAGPLTLRLRLSVRCSSCSTHISRISGRGLLPDLMLMPSTPGYDKTGSLTRMCGRCLQVCAMMSSCDAIRMGVNAGAADISAGHRNLLQGELRPCVSGSRLRSKHLLDTVHPTVSPSTGSH
jgi:hypothetical protein